MRRVSRSVATATDTQYFRRVERIATEKALCPTNYQDYELKAMLRKEHALTREVKVVKPSEDFLENFTQTRMALT